MSKGNLFNSHKYLMCEKIMLNTCNSCLTAHTNKVRNGIKGGKIKPVKTQHRSVIVPLVSYFRHQKNAPMHVLSEGFKLSTRTISKILSSESRDFRHKRANLSATSIKNASLRDEIVKIKTRIVYLLAIGLTPNQIDLCKILDPDG